MRLHMGVLLAVAMLGIGGSVSAQEAAKPDAGASQQSNKTMAAPASTVGTTGAGRFENGPATQQAAAARVDGVQTRNAMAEKDALPPAPRAHHTGRSSALMIVGGVGIVVGALIGGQAGSILMLGSGAVGLYGLYLYLQ